MPTGARPDKGTPILEGDTKYPGQVWFDWFGYLQDRIGTAREILTASRTYYVSPTGNDANHGLRSGEAFLTMQKAVDTVANSVDFAGNAVTIQLADGTYPAGFVLAAPQIGPGSFTIQGNAGAPGNVIVSSTGTGCATVIGGSVIIKDMELRTTTAGDCLVSAQHGEIDFLNLRFGACAGFHMQVYNHGIISGSGNYAITGGAIAHLHAFALGIITIVSGTVTLSGTPNFSSWFAGAAIANIGISGITYSGPATGVRYLSHKNAVIDTSGGGATFFPGNSAGSVSDGGIYV